MTPWRFVWLIGVAMPLPALALTPVPARPSSAFSDSVGVNTHLTSEWDTAYSDCANGPRATAPCPPSVAHIGAALRTINVRHIRDGFPAAYVAPRFRALANIVPGLRIDFVMNDDRSGPLEQQFGYAAPDADLIEFVEGPNEPNNGSGFRYHKHPFPKGAAEEMRDLRAALPHSPLSHARIINLALGGGTEADSGRLGVVPEAEFANAHAYYGVRPPRRFTQGLDPAQNLAPGKPTVITETGNCTPDVRTDWCAVTETVQAKYTLMALADAFEIGVVRTYLYELVDEQPDPTGADVERHFGLFHTDWSLKPAGQALVNLQSALGTGGMAGSLAFSTPGARTVVLRRDDGVYLIIAWFDAELWDTERHVAHQVAPRPITLTLGLRPAGVAIFDPLDASRRTLEPGTALKLELPDHPIVIEVKNEEPLPAR